MSIRIENYALEKVCSRDNRSPSMEQPHFDGKRLLATNGHALAVIPCEPDDHDATSIPGPISLEAFKLARKGKDTQALLLDAGAVRLANGQSFPRPDLGPYPKIDQAIPKLADDAVPDLCLDADLLAALAAAICLNKDRKVELYFQRNDDGSTNYKRGFTVKPTAELTGAFGVLMPCRLSK